MDFQFNPKLLAKQRANLRSFMVASKLNSRRYPYRNLGRKFQYETLAEGSLDSCHAAGFDHRRWNKWQPAFGLLPESMPVRHMSGKIVDRIVEQRLIGGRIWRIVTGLSGRMISSLPAISVAIWLTIAFSLVVLSAVLAFSRSSARYPGFSILIYFTTCGCFVLLMVGWLASLWTYFWTYYAYRVISDLLTALVAWEVYRKVFGPARALPAAAPRRIALHLLTVLGLWVMLGFLLRATVSKPFARIALTGEQMLYGALAATFGVLLLYSRKMGITWRPRVAKITYGFALILIVNLAMAVLRGRTHGQLARTADDIGQIAYLLSYVYWVWCFLEKEQPVPTSVPPELVSALARELEAVRSTGEASPQV